MFCEDDFSKNSRKKLRDRTVGLGDHFIGRSSVFHSIVRKIKTVGPRACPVIIKGETGTGKELVARQIHSESPRRGRAFMPVDCTSLTGQLFESQLFGHTKGAFTGATSDTLGFFRAAEGGTIFLDEIEELGPGLQSKLLRVLQDCCVNPVGSTKVYHINVRTLCATNKNLRSMVLEGQFRADLYYRLNVVTIEIPPLRKRKEDIIPLSEYFLSKQSELYAEPEKVLMPSAVKVLVGYSWPGNVRELANSMERAFVMSTTEKIEAKDLPAEIFSADILPANEQSVPTLDEVTKELVLRALKTTSGRKMAASRLLGIDHRKLNRLLARFGLHPCYR